MPRRSTGRGVQTLLTDFGHDLPTAAPVPVREVGLGPDVQVVARRGVRLAGAGWTAVPAPLAAFRMTSEQVGGVWPLIPAEGLPPTGALVGIDWLSGGAFYCDPIGWTLHNTAGVTNPNMMIFGAPGRGKSSAVKTIALRLMAYGYRTLILGDVKDEYEGLCRALGVSPHAVGPGLPARINPLDFGPLGRDWTHLGREEAARRAAIVFARWLQLLRGLVGSQKVPFGPTAESAVGQILRDLTGYATGATSLTEITIPQVWQALCDPTPQLVTGCRYRSRQHFLDDTRGVRDALGALVHGHLGGLFDAPTTVKVDWRAPIQSLSLSRLEPLGDEAVGIALMALNSWGRAMTDVPHLSGHQPSGQVDLRVVVRDEAWKQMRLGEQAVASLDADLRLSRRDGAIQIVVAHKPSDMLTVGDAGSAAVAIAKELLHLCSTKVLLGQDEAIGDELSGLLGLTPMASGIVTGWATGGRGRALWVVGSRQFQVSGILTATETALTDTNNAITPSAPRGLSPVVPSDDSAAGAASR
ncbi:ATP-binding protein [Kineosporia sp. A_224]|uniref:ATP-binding protein n=1 Tax=Kineosporia sp. A_224 TaxID=1962180 RepID=UPI000B4BD4EA